MFLNSIYNCIRKNKIPRNKINQGGKIPVHWNYKILKKKKGKGHKWLEIYSVLMG